MTYYKLNENNQIVICGNEKLADDWLETDKKIVRGFDGILRFEEDTQKKEYLLAKTNFEKVIDINNQITEKKVRLEELTKDLAQVQAGLVIDNIEEKKAEFRTLLNEVRVLQGKEPREYKE